MKKISVVVLTICLLLVFTACGGEKVDEVTASKYINKAEEIVLLLNEEKYQEMTDTFDDLMKAELSVEKLKEIGPMIQQSGEFESIDKSSVEKKDGIYIVVLVGKYSDDKRVFTISFNEDDEVSGLYVK